MKEYRLGLYEKSMPNSLSLGEKTYLLRRAEVFYYGNEPLYRWALCVEKGVNDTWGTQS